MVLRQFSIDEVPLSLECATQDGSAGFVCRRFKLIEGVSGWRVETSVAGRSKGGQFGHLVRGGIVHAADQHLNMAHGMLLATDRTRMLPRVYET